MAVRERVEQVERSGERGHAGLRVVATVTDADDAAAAPSGPALLGRLRARLGLTPRAGAPGARLHPWEPGAERDLRRR